MDATLSIATHTAPMLRRDELTRRGALRVPEVTAFFWIIKGLSTAMGESTSDYMVKTMAPEPMPAARTPIVGYELGGSRIDPEEKLQELMRSVSAVGDPFIESGPSDKIGQPFGTIPRLVQMFDAVGYRATVTTRPGAGGPRETNPAPPRCTRPCPV